MGGLFAEGRGVTQSWSRAASWWEKASVQGDPRAAVRLGELYRDGKGVDEDHATAVK